MTHGPTRSLCDRRTVLGASLLGGIAMATGACAGGRNGSPGSGPSPTQQPTSQARQAGSRVLLAYFSRPGENYYYGDRVDLEVGNTKVLAGILAGQLDCDVHEIRAAERYSDDYDETVARNTREQDDEARPAIADPLGSIDQYDVVLLASPIWNVRPPRIMHTFAESHDFTGTTVHPVTTHAMSGLGASEREYAETCRGATLAEGLAVRGEEVRGAEDTVITWLRRTGLV